MGKRRADAGSRKFFDEFSKVRISRFRAMGIVDPAKSQALIPFPNGKTKLIGTYHIAIRNGGGWSRFLCPKCGRRCLVLYLVEDAPLCVKCCDALNIKDRSQYGFGRGQRRQASDKALDQLIAKLETDERLRFKPAPPSWRGKAQRVYQSLRLAQNMQRSMVTLRLNQLAAQHANDSGALDVTRACKPRAAALAAIPDLAPIWRANSTETLEQALDKAQSAILKALKSPNPRRRFAAAAIMLNTKQARQLGFVR